MESDVNFVQNIDLLALAQIEEEMFFVHIPCAGRLISKLPFNQGGDEGAIPFLRSHSRRSSFTNVTNPNSERGGYETAHKP